MHKNKYKNVLTLAIKYTIILTSAVKLTKKQPWAI